MTGMPYSARGRAGPKSNWHDYYATESSGYPTVTEASALVPVVGAYYPLARIADAYRHVDAGHKKGSIVVTMS
jgi:Zinc-binding dehydrogenase